MGNVFTLKKEVNINSSVKTCASILVETLETLGVESIFGYPGASVLSIYNELSNSKKIKHYLVRHEQAAIHAAEGYARVSGKAGTVLVTSGPGFTNTITGIANAYADYTPLVVLTGVVPNEKNNGKVFQNVDIVSMTQSCTKKTYIITKNDDVAQVIKEAYKLAASGIKGPVVIGLPRNVLESKYLPKQKVSFLEKEVKSDINKNVNKFISLLKSSKNPLILAGGGASNSSENVIKLAKLLNCPVVSTLMGIGVFPSDSENYAGMIGINGTYTANKILSNSDLVIALGVSFSDRSTCKNSKFARNAKVVSVNLKNISHICELKINSSVNDFINSVLSKNIIYTNSGYLQKQIKIFKEEECVSENNSENLHSSFVLKTISEFTKTKEPVVVTDVGQHQMLTAQYFNFNKPRKFITSGGLGTMGFGLPASIGAYIADRHSLILNITGDGSYQMNLQELATCREHNIPVKIIIMNNGYLGMVRQMQEKIYQNTYQVEMTNPDFKKIAEAYDLFAIRVTKKENLIPALNKAFEHKGTAIVDILIDSHEEI